MIVFPNFVVILDRAMLNSEQDYPQLSVFLMNGDLDSSVRKILLVLNKLVQIITTLESYSRGPLSSLPK